MTEQEQVDEALGFKVVHILQNYEAYKAGLNWYSISDVKTQAEQENEFRSSLCQSIGYDVRELINMIANGILRAPVDPGMWIGDQGGKTPPPSGAG